MADRPHKSSRHGAGRDRRDGDAGRNRADREHHRDVDKDRKHRDRSRSPRDQAHRRDRKRDYDDDRDRRRRDGLERTHRERDHHHGRDDRIKDRGEKKDRSGKPRDRELKELARGMCRPPPNIRSLSPCSYRHIPDDDRKRKEAPSDDLERPQRQPSPKRRSRSPRREPSEEREELALPTHLRKKEKSSTPAPPPVHIKLATGDGKRDLDAPRPLESVETPDRYADDMEVDDEEDDIVVDDDGMAAMQAMMGFGSFDTTKGKKVKGNNVGAVRKEKTTEYRQYMNRVGGFNRPLSPGR